MLNRARRSKFVGLVEAHLYRREVARGRLVGSATGGQFGQHIYSRSLLQFRDYLADIQAQEAMDALSLTTYVEVEAMRLRVKAIKDEVEGNPDMPLEEKQALLAEAFKLRDKIEAATAVMETLASGYE